MNYVEHLDILGAVAKEIPCVREEGAPTAETVGAVGLLYMDTLTGAVYKCTAVSDGGYTWVLFAEANTFTDAKYFDIDYDGVISLKPEYRGRPGNADDISVTNKLIDLNDYPYAISDNGVGVDGSKIDELPEEIVIPEMIGNTAVAGLQKGMFYFNYRVKKIVFPDGVTAIPDCFCNDARSLRTIENTEHVRSIGVRAFRDSGIDKALFPNLKEMGVSAFQQCKYLTLIDIGNNITSIPDNAFWGCGNLSRVVGGAGVKSLGARSFVLCYRLKNLPLLANVTSMSDWAITSSRVTYDWDSMTGCTFGTNATPVIDNTTEYWTGSTFTPCENPLNSLFDQQDPRWKNEPFGTSGYTYTQCCAVLALLHIHSALSGKTYNSPIEFEEELTQLGTVDMSSIPGYSSWVNDTAKALGYKTTYVTGNITAADYQNILDKLAAGAYVYLAIGNLANINGGHAVVLYGVNDIGEVKAVDSDFGYYLVNGGYRAETYELPFQNVTGPSSDFVIIEKA